MRRFQSVLRLRSFLVSLALVLGSATFPSRSAAQSGGWAWMGSNRPISLADGGQPGIYGMEHEIASANALGNRAVHADSTGPPATAPAALIAPASGSTLPGMTSTTFTWTAGAGVMVYVLRLGTTGPGSSDLYDSNMTRALSATISPIPANGMAVYATLYSLINGIWQQANYTFVESGRLTPASLISPVPSSVLSGTAATTFTWTAGTGVTCYVLRLGTTGSGSNDLYDSNVTRTLSATVGPLPTNEVTIYATLYSLINGAWQGNQYTYTESAVAANWYVDSVDGSDLNSGQDINHPYKSIGRLLSSAITSGQTIGLKAGSHWREMLTVPAANVTVTSYGTGEKPLLDASDVVNSALWSKVSGTTNVYQVSVPIDADPNITWVNVWENGNFLVRTTSIANCDATPGSYYPSADTGDGTIPIILYIHTSDGSNPGANGRLYEYSKRQEALDTGSYPNVKITGLWLRRNLSAHGSLGIGGAGSLADQLLITDGSKHNAYICPGVSMTDVELRDQYYGNQDFFLLVINGNGMPGDTTLTRVHAHNTVSTLAGDGIGSHTNDGNPFTGTLTCIDCEVDNTQRGFDPGGWDHVVFVRPITSGTQSGIDVLGNLSTSITDGNIVALNGNGVNNGGAPTINSTLVIQGTTITSMGGNAILAGAGSTTITSSTISSADGIHGPIYITSGNFVLNGNTINRGTTSAQPFYVLPIGASGTSDYNTFISNATSGTPFWFGAGQYSFSLWQESGYDLHSTTQ